MDNLMEAEFSQCACL